MEVRAAAIPEDKLIRPARFGDHRGYFSEVYNKRALAEAGIDLDFVQDNQSRSASRGTPSRSSARSRRGTGTGGGIRSAASGSRSGATCASWGA